VGEDADGAGQDEEATGELWVEAQFAVDDCGGAVDVHRDWPCSSLGELTFDLDGRPQMLAFDFSAFDSS
jgi:hypothetical protein